MDGGVSVKTCENDYVFKKPEISRITARLTRCDESAAMTSKKIDQSSIERVTVIDVAREAGVSPSTVSRIVTGTARVSDKKRKSVEAVIARMGFVPNMMARGLKSGRTMTLGVVIPEMTSAFFEAALSGIEAAVQGSGYVPIVMSGHWDAKEEAQRIEFMQLRPVDGIILLSGRMSTDEILRFSRVRPIAALGRTLQSRHAVAVDLDNRQGAFDATDHLIGLGHRRIAFIAGPTDHRDAEERLGGYRDALKAANLPFDRALVAQGDFHESGGLLAMNRLLDSAPDFSAVFAANDQTAYGARLALYRRGIRLPDDMSLVGFDDLPSSRYTTPPLTTIRQPMFELGGILVKAVLDLIGGNPVALDAPPMELVVRESTRRRGQ